MIILIHGTGDDDTKPENWMVWVGKILARHGEQVLVLPGVESSQQDALGDTAQRFLAGLDGHNARRNPGGPPAPAALRQSLTQGGGELMSVSGLRVGQEKAQILDLVQNKRHEAGMGTSGIKIRIAVASLCAIAYYSRAANPRPIRIIGHSRGGSAAIGVHNLLTFNNIPCDHTLSLDPCHGATKIGGGQKTYFHKVWRGTVTNIPCKKNVGGLPKWATYRPLITAGQGGNANITNLNPVQKIKHGHMGKMQNITDDEKTTVRAAITSHFERIVAKPINNLSLAQHLDELFKTGTTRSADYTDKVFIQSQVVGTLTR